jgi:hypothetical protein
MKTETSGPLANRILAALSQADFSRVGPLLEAVSYEQGVLLQEPGDEVEHIHFPHTGIKDGKAIETATVGREGVVGAMAGLGLHMNLARAVVQVPVIGSRIAAAPSEKLCSKATNYET